jgi:hypothetical protein
VRGLVGDDVVDITKIKGWDDESGDSVLSVNGGGFTILDLRITICFDFGFRIC